MRQTIEDAEQTEPLLAERLYDAGRNCAGPERRAGARSRPSGRCGRACSHDAQQQEQPAGRGISQLREGIERAAEAVLGDETEALRRAREELQNLSPRAERRDQPQRARPSRRQAGQGDRRPAEPGQPENSQEQGNSSRAEGQADKAARRGSKGKGQKGAEGAARSEGQKGQKGKSKVQKGKRPRQGQQGQKGQRPERSRARPARAKGKGGKAGQAARVRRKAARRKTGNQQHGERQARSAASGNSGQRDGERQRRRQSAQIERRPGPAATSEMFGAADRRATSASGPIGCATWKKWSTIRSCGPRRRGFASGPGRCGPSSSGIRSEPNWDLVQPQVAGPLVELRDRVATELLRRTAKQAIVPLDRDPVPPKYSEKTRLYYERLGSGK